MYDIYVCTYAPYFWKVGIYEEKWEVFQNLCNLWVKIRRILGVSLFACHLHCQNQKVFLWLHESKEAHWHQWKQETEKNMNCKGQLSFDMNAIKIYHLCNSLQILCLKSEKSILQNQWLKPHSKIDVILFPIPSRELTYPPKIAFWRWFSFSQDGIC